MKSIHKPLIICVTLLVSWVSLRAQDSLSLRNSAIDVVIKKDSSDYSFYAESYFKIIKEPHALDNLDVLVPLILDANSSILPFLLKHYPATKEHKSLQYFEVLKWKIYEKYIPQFQGGKKNVQQWLDLQRDIEEKYGVAGREIIERYQLIILSEEDSDWKTFRKLVSSYIKRNQVPIYINDTNQLCWYIFQKSMDPILLNQAASWLKFHVDSNAVFQVIDTYANLLYKSGRKKEAISWEERALKMSGNDHHIQETLQKMKAGGSTW